MLHRLHFMSSSFQNYLDKSVVRQFIQLRADFRFIKNTNYLKSIME